MRFKAADRYSEELQACVEIPDEKYWVCDISLEFFTTDIYILASVEKEKRRLKTAPMLQNGMEKGKCHIFVGKRFSLDRYSDLKAVTEDENTLLLFPSEEAIDLQDYIDTVPDYKQRTHQLIVLDGTWLLAKGIYCKNPFLQKLKQVKISHNRLSEYVIRTQPTDTSLSTLESVALALSLLDNKPHLYDVLVSPLRAMCEFQMQHGAVVHQSKESLVRHGLYRKQQPRPGQQKATKKKHKPPTPTEESVKNTHITIPTDQQCHDLHDSNQ